jgi:hypothetical protein
MVLIIRNGKRRLDWSLLATIWPAMACRRRGPMKAKCSGATAS